MYQRSCLPGLGTQYGNQADDRFEAGQTGLLDPGFNVRCGLAVKVREIPGAGVETVRCPKLWQLSMIQPKMTRMMSHPHAQTRCSLPQQTRLVKLRLGLKSVWQQADWHFTPLHSNVQEHCSSCSRGCRAYHSGALLHLTAAGCAVELATSCHKGLLCQCMLSPFIVSQATWMMNRVGLLS